MQQKLTIAVLLIGLLLSGKALAIPLVIDLENGTTTSVTNAVNFQSGVYTFAPTELEEGDTIILDITFANGQALKVLPKTDGTAETSGIKEIFDVAIGLQEVEHFGAGTGSIELTGVQGSLLATNPDLNQQANFGSGSGDPSAIKIAMGTLGTVNLTDVATGFSFDDLHVEATIDSIELPSTATLVTAASFNFFIQAGGFEILNPDPDLDPDPSPVSEPSIVALFAAGLFGLGFTRRRMRG